MSASFPSTFSSESSDGRVVLTMAVREATLSTFVRP
jgi:hypothetical protein